MKRKTLIAWALTLCLLTLLVTAAGAQEDEITITDLGTLGGDVSYAYDINNLGNVVGTAETADGTDHAFLWTEATGMIDLGTLGGDYSSASGINDLNQIVGMSYINESEFHVFMWTEADGMTDLGMLGGTTINVWRINNSGQLVGSMTCPQYLYHSQS